MLGTRLKLARLFVAHETNPDRGPTITDFLCLSMAAGDGPGPIGAYPHSDFWKRPNWNDEQVISEDYLAAAQQWVELGVQINRGLLWHGRQRVL